MGVFSRQPGELKGKIIEGLLSTTSKHVLLFALAKHGGHFRSNNLSQDGYRAIHCLVSYSRFPPLNDDTLFQTIDIDLTGYEGWLRLRSIESERTDSTIAVSYRKKDPVVYEIDEGTITVEYDILGPHLGTFRDESLTMTEKVALVYTPKKPLALAEWRKRFVELEDLFILLTNSDYCFLWPTISLVTNDRSLTFEWYAFRKRSSAKPPAWHECLTNFVKLEKQFGAIASSWMKKRERFGPGFYIYIGVRRAEQTYIEYRFLNLIIGIESLHRRMHVLPSESKLLNKIARIIDQVTNNRDKKWLISKLENAHEPSLAQRIFDVISTAPLKLEKERLCEFSTRCGHLRNDLSHFGAQRNGINYDEFIREIAQKNEAISIIYHMVILHEIGVDDDTIYEWIYTGSFPAKGHFVEAGLLDKSVLNPPAPLVLPEANPAS